MTHFMNVPMYNSPQTQDSSPSAYTFPDLAVQQRGAEFQRGFLEGFAAAERTGVCADSESSSSDNSEGDYTAELLKEARAEIDRLQNQLVALEEAYNELLRQVTSHAQRDICESDSGVDVDEKQNLLTDTTNDSDSDSDESFHYVGKSTSIGFGEGAERGDVPEREQEQVASLDLKLMAGDTVTEASDQAFSTTFAIHPGPEQEGSSSIPGSERQEDEGVAALQSFDLPSPSSPTQLDLRSYSVEQVRELMDRAHGVGGEEATTQVKFLVSKAHATPPALRTEVHTVLLNEWRRPQVQTSTLSANIPTFVPSSENYVYVDASDVGIGFVFDNRWEAWRLRNGWRQGGWKQGKLRDIQWAETVAVELGVRVMIKAGYAGRAITLYSDNMQVVQAFSQGRPIGEPLAQEVLNNTGRLCQQLKIRLRVMWIPGAKNPADEPSRLNVGSAKARFPCHAEIPPYLQDVVLPFYQ